MVTRDLVGARVVAVHAHPDDEALFGGGILAQLASHGAEVTVVTCTLGEQGEVIGAPYSGLVADEADQLGGFRIAELQHSLAALGVRGEHLLRAGAFRDSGMVGSPSAEHPRAFVNCGEEATAALREVFERIRPQLVLTYGPDGGYGHPDHIQAHRITHAAAEGSGIQRIVWSVNSAAHTAAALADITEVPRGWRMPETGELAVVDSWDIEVELSDQDLAARLEAMRAHPTQIWVADGTVSATNPEAAYAGVKSTAECAAVFALSNLITQPVMRTEYAQLGAGTAFPVGASDIMAGLTW